MGTCAVSSERILERGLLGQDMTEEAVMERVKNAKPWFGFQQVSDADQARLREISASASAATGGAGGGDGKSQTDGSDSSGRDNNDVGGEAARGERRRSLLSLAIQDRAEAQKTAGEGSADAVEGVDGVKRGGFWSFLPIQVISHEEHARRIEERLVEIDEMLAADDAAAQLEAAEDGSNDGSVAYGQ